MNVYEKLEDEATEMGLTVKEKPLLSSDGRIKGKRIAISNRLNTTIEKACVLAEELGHYHTTVGNILTDSHGNRKQEYQARLWAYEKLIGLERLVDACLAGCETPHETAEFLDVTVEFLEEAINAYRSKNGDCSKIIKGCKVAFVPRFEIKKLSPEEA